MEKKSTLEIFAAKASAAMKRKGLTDTLVTR